MWKVALKGLENKSHLVPILGVEFLWMMWKSRALTVLKHVILNPL